MKKKFLAVLLAVAMVLGVTACGSSKDSSKSTTEAVKKEETTTITLAAAASLEKCYTEKLIPMFEEENKEIKVEGSYDSSGKLQSQIENGMAADVFMSAATEQMNNLVKGKYISKGDVVELLENKVVLIAPKKGDAKVSLEFAGHGFDILVHNPDKLEPGDAHVKRALCDDVKVENVTGNSVRIPKHAIEMLSTDKCHTVEIYIE